MTMGVRIKISSPAGQFIVKPGPSNVLPGSSRDLQISRQKTQDCGFWGLIPGAKGERPRSLTFVTHDSTQELILLGSRPKSETKKRNREKLITKHRIPVLGPTRQQTELYLQNMSRKRTDDLRLVYFNCVRFIMVYVLYHL